MFENQKKREHMDTCIKEIFT